tara:strand:+ start:378 stop:620 length:243 start_codon:yes stop_codon:yes gene_type:complete
MTKDNFQLEIDLSQAIRNFYPGLTDEEISVIASQIYLNWDYSDIYEKIRTEISVVSDETGISLTNKDGISTNLRHLRIVK